MKLRNLTRLDALSLLDELRAMAMVEPGPDPKRLARAKEIRFQLQGQEWASRWTPPNKRLKLAARVDCGMNLSSARRSLSAIR
jgi:hypothetical protein